GRRIVERALVERLILRMGSHRAQPDGVSVGRSLRDALRPRHAAGAADVLDDHLLAEQLTHAVRDQAGEHVGWAAGCEWDDHRDWLRGIVLRAPGAGERACGDECRRYSVAHALPPCLSSTNETGVGPRSRLLAA